MQKIYWTCFYDENMKKYIAIALSPTESGVCYNFTLNDNYKKIYETFDTFEKLHTAITELKKPLYAKHFNCHYELEYLLFDSSEWDTIFEKWEEFIKELQEIQTSSIPWYYKFFSYFI